jgi:tripeptidyl-peptidase-1
MNTILLAAALLVAAATAASTVEVELHLRGVHTDAEIEQAFVARSTPGSALFRQHLDAAGLAALVGASDKTVESVLAFVKTSGAIVEKVHATRDIIDCVVPAESEAAKLFGLTAADFAGFVRRPAAVPAALTFEVSMAIASQYAAPTLGKPSGKSTMKKKMPELQFPGADQTPQGIMGRYKVPAANPVYPANFSQGVGEYQSSYFTQADVTTFSTKYNLKHPVVSVNGPNSKSSDDIEGTLDVEYITAISGAAHTWWISNNKPGPDGEALNFVNWAEQVLTIPSPPSVVSISWGVGESSYYKKEQLLVADNAAFRKLGLRGVTVFVASGDSGPGARRFLNCKVFDPSWPASSPYVTAVGATYSATASSEGETSVNFSGGGFSNYFKTPEWQKTAVAAYLASGAKLPKPSFFNATGRGFPDVAALGTNFMIFAPGQMGGGSTWWPVSGTSCASPTFAAVITRVNAHRLAAGKPTLGFLNPAIYALGKVGYDVAAGSSVDTDCFGIPIPGFPAVKGWDAVSGLGTPDFTFLANSL